MALNLSNRMTNRPETEGKNIRRRLYVIAKSSPTKKVKKLFYKMCGKEGGLP